MTMVAFLFDLLLAGFLVTLAWIALRSRDHYRSVSVFMLFGLLMSLAWVRVDAPDLALAEAAIGAGITGALFLGVIRRFNLAGDAAPAGRVVTTTALLLCLVLAAVLSAAVCQAWTAPPGLTDAVHGTLRRSGVENPVTAVILNFRAYDTFLEIAVLLIAVLGVWIVALRTGRPAPAPRRGIPVLQALLRFMPAVLALTALYTVWVGYRHVGGAFQAGALLGGMGVMMLLNGDRLPLSIDSPLCRLLLAAGFTVFAGAALGAAGGGTLLAYPEPSAKYWILAIELACVGSIGLTLAGVFAGCAGFLGRDGKDRS